MLRYGHLEFDATPNGLTLASCDLGARALLEIDIREDILVELTTLVSSSIAADSRGEIDVDLEIDEHREPKKRRQLHCHARLHDDHIFVDICDLSEFLTELDVLRRSLMKSWIQQSILGEFMACSSDCFWASDPEDRLIDLRCSSNYMQYPVLAVGSAKKIFDILTDDDTNSIEIMKCISNRQPFHMKKTRICVSDCGRKPGAAAKDATAWVRLSGRPVFDPWSGFMGFRGAANFIEPATLEVSGVPLPFGQLYPC